MTPHSISPKRLAAIIGVGVVIAAIYGKSLYDLFVYAAGESMHSHILLVPFISTYLIAIQRHQFASKESSPSFVWGAVFLVIGGALLLLGRTLELTNVSLNDGLAMMTLSFLCVLMGVGFLFVDRESLKRAAFPIAFLIFLVPLPDQVVDWLESASKLASAEVAACLFGISGTPLLRDGVVFQLPGIVIEVAQECSGIRSSWVLFITSLVAAHLFLKTGWRRLLLVAFVIPLGVIRNGFRVWVIGMLCVHVGPHMIHSPIHRRGGPFFFALSLIPLFLVLWWLRRNEVNDPPAAPGMTPEIAAEPGTRV